MVGWFYTPIQTGNRLTHDAENCKRFGGCVGVGKYKGSGQSQKMPPTASIYSNPNPGGVVVICGYKLVRGYRQPHVRSAPAPKEYHMPEVTTKTVGLAGDGRIRADSLTEFPCPPCAHSETHFIKWDFCWLT